MFSSKMPEDPAALKEFDVQTLVERTRDGLRIVEGEASGALQESGEWFQASLPTGIVRLRLTETHDIARDFKSSASAPWEGELVGHIGFNQSQAAALMSLGVGEAPPLPSNRHMRISIYLSISLSLYIYIYTNVCICVCVYIYIYIYIHI